MRFDSQIPSPKSGRLQIENDSPENASGSVVDREPFWPNDRVSGDHAIPAWKRALDVSCILLSLPLWWPIMVIVALWITIVSHGPIFFRQERVGFRGKRFMIWKFRSMKVCAETRSHESHFDRLVEANCPMTKLDALGDTRVIRGGWFLRATGLDELPQIFNVLAGEMSLVGPRPCTPRELPKFSHHRRRFDALPGLTGYWQVNGKNRTTFLQMIEHDIHYAESMSLRLDLEIMARTVPAILQQLREIREAARSAPRDLPVPKTEPQELPPGRVAKET